MRLSISYPWSHPPRFTILISFLSAQLPIWARISYFFTESRELHKFSVLSHWWLLPFLLCLQLIFKISSFKLETIIVTWFLFYIFTELFIFIFLSLFISWCKSWPIIRGPDIIHNISCLLFKWFLITNHQGVPRISS